MIDWNPMRAACLVLGGLFLHAWPAAVIAQGSYPENGWWWDAEAPGRGFFIERQDAVMFVAAFVYDDEGNPEWLTAIGEFSPAEPETGLMGTFLGEVYRSEAGQCIGCPYQTPLTEASAQGPLTIEFTDNQQGALTWSAETLHIQRYLWSWDDAVDQLAGNWLYSAVEESIPVSRLVRIEAKDPTGEASVIDLVDGEQVGSVALFDQDLVLLLEGATEPELPLVMPESNRLYAGYGDANALQVLAVRLDDTPFADGLVSSWDGTTLGVLCSYDDATVNSQASLSTTSLARWSCADGMRSLSANGIPDHAVGAFPNGANPNTISEQSVAASFSLAPVHTGTATPLGGPAGVTGYVLNGVKIDAATAGSCDNSGQNCSLVGNNGAWSIEALGQSSFDFGTDENNAHVQPDGAYHYHGMPEGFIEKQGGGSHTMTLIGWAADGFPIYARYGYRNAQDAGSGLVAMTGSYQLVETVSATRPSTALYALGTFAQDWEYVEGSGDLDECNGREGVTPEFPEGIYHYYATDSYPYFQRCVKGEVDTVPAQAGRP